MRSGTDCINIHFIRIIIHNPYVKNRAVVCSVDFVVARSFENYGAPKCRQFKLSCRNSTPGGAPIYQTPAYYQ